MLKAFVYLYTLTLLHEWKRIFEHVLHQIVMTLYVVVNLLYEMAHTCGHVDECHHNLMHYVFKSVNEQVYK